MIIPNNFHKISVLYTARAIYFCCKLPHLYYMKILIKSFVTFCFLLIPFSAIAEGISIVRDEETEKYLNDISSPVFTAAKLEPNSIKIFIVNSPVLNAFVAGGQNMFINTGLMILSNDPSLLIGVMAHETGHISGGHLIRKLDEASEAGFKATLGYILGAASVAAGAPPAAGMAIMQGGQHIAERQFLKHSREHEESADQAALNILEQIGTSPAGLLELLEKLNAEQRTVYGDLNPYIQTHPLSSERVSHVRAALNNLSNVDVPTKKDLKSRHMRIVAKLRGFIEKPEKVLEDFPESDNSLPARYARAIAYYRIPELKKAISETNSLIEDFPEDPYFYELKGQILFENGYVDESIIYYKKTTAMLQNSVLPRLELATAQLASQHDMSNEAAENLEKVILYDPENAFAWHQLGIAYGRSGRLGLSYLALAEKAALSGNKEDVIKMMNLAKKNIPAGFPIEVREKDIIKTLEKVTGKKD